MLAVQHDPAEPMWRSSSYSSGNGQCVEVGDTAPTRARVSVRDSKTAPTGPRLSFGEGAWTPFVAAVGTGRL
ncbi:DUF397 domain-containing protein [Streptomyces sp. NPDC001930]|uniref:DUF397 domain-containing protein n=1 Tax=Streptomyces sp. NPDC001930 TaxID=3364625 RepID=UPI00369D67FD